MRVLESEANERNSSAVARVSEERLLGLCSDRASSWARLRGIVDKGFGFEAPRGGLQLKSNKPFYNKIKLRARPIPTAVGLLDRRRRPRRRNDERTSGDEFRKRGKLRDVVDTGINQVLIQINLR